MSSDEQKILEINQLARSAERTPLRRSALPEVLIHTAEDEKTLNKGKREIW